MSKCIRCGEIMKEYEIFNDDAFCHKCISKVREVKLKYHVKLVINGYKAPDFKCRIWYDLDDGVIHKVDIVSDYVQLCS